LNELSPESLTFRDLIVETIHQKEKLIAKLKNQLSETSQLTYQKTFFEGSSFGEKAIVNK